jgi:hypothetical protein
MAELARELARLNASTKGYHSAFVLRNRLAQALPLYNNGPNTSRWHKIDEALIKLGPADEQVHETYQRLLNLDADKAHHNNYEERQDITGKEYNDLRAMADEVLGHVEGQHVRQQQQQQPLAQGDIVAATVAAMQAANGQAGPKKIDYHLKPKMLRIWCNWMTFFWDAQLMETKVKQVRWANFFDCMHLSLKTGSAPPVYNNF